MVSSRARAAAPMPPRIDPMLAIAGALPLDPQNWGFEYKWDGVRCMTFWDGRALKLLSRNHIVITQRYPELAGLGASLGRRAVVLDGEIIALDGAGRPSFPQLQLRMHVDNPSPALVRSTPAWYVIFDILHADGRSTMEREYVDRRAILGSTVKRGKHWHLSPFEIGDGQAMLESARQNSMEGVVAKVLTSPYLPGRRSPLWRKIKIIFGQEFVIGGWLPEAGQRDGRVGALLLGYYEPAPRGKKVLRYAGRVGTGFSDATHAQLITSLKRAGAGKNPFVDKVPGVSTAIFVKPKLVAEVEFRRWPEGGLVQQAAFKGLRTDKSAAAVVKEPLTGGLS